MLFIKQRINFKYLFFGFSTICGRLFEYIVILFIASYYSKELYGSFEFYKKVIELISSFVAFGFPTLLLTYTKSSNSKINFTLLSLIFSFILLIVISPILYWQNLLFLIIPLLFYSSFFYSGSIIQSFHIVYHGSNFTAYYKIILSFVFSCLIFLLAYYFNYEDKALIASCYVILPVLLCIYMYKFFNYYTLDVFSNIRRYFNIFNKMILSSFSLVINNFVNMAFLYTDIFIIKLLADSPMKLIAEYSLPLNVANILLIIPLTIAQVDIEIIKSNHKRIFYIISRTNKYVLIFIIPLTISYWVLTTILLDQYKDTFLLFIIIMVAKFFQAKTIPYGLFLIIKKEFSFNLIVNLSLLLINILLSYLSFNSFGLYGIAFVSMFMLGLRQLILRAKLNSVLSSLKI